jgi:hypothetical protein
MQGYEKIFIIKLTLIILLFFTFLGGGCFAMRFVGGGSLKIRGPTSSDIGFNTEVQTIQTVVDPGSTENTTVQDLDTTIRTSPTILAEGLIGLYFTSNFSPFNPVTFKTLDSDIASVDYFGQVARVSDGTARILTGNTFLKKVVEVPVSLISGETTQTYNGFIAGVLGKNSSDNIDSRITEVTTENASTYKPIFSTRNDATATYIRNTGSWVYGLDLTPMSVYNSDLGSRKAGTLISPRHIIFAEHYTIANGSKIRFVTSDNVVVERTLVSSINPVSDIRVGVLDSDVPETISFAKIFPAEWTSYIPGLSFGVPCFYTDQEKKALVNVLYNGQNSSFGFIPPTDQYPHRAALYETLIGGDSGSPAFMIVNDELVILTTWQYSGSGPNFTFFKDQINTAMTSLGGGYQLQEVDLSGFTKF